MTTAIGSQRARKHQDHIYYYRFGELTVHLECAPDAPAVRGELEVAYARQLAERVASLGVKLYPNPYQGPNGPRLPVGFTRGESGGLLQTMSLASWTPDIDRLAARPGPLLGRLVEAVRQVGEEVTRLNHRLAELKDEERTLLGGRYRLRTVSPTWTASSFQI
jgi:hypothetical protein